MGTDFSAVITHACTLQMIHMYGPMNLRLQHCDKY